MLLVTKNKAISRSVWAVTLFILATVWGAVVVLSGLYKADLVEGKRQELIQMNNVVAQHTAALFKAVETDLRVMALWMRAERDRDPLSDPVFHEFIQRLRQNSDGLVDIRLISSEGKAYAAPVSPQEPVRDIKDRDYFREYKAEDNEKLHIGDPVRGRINGRWVIPIYLGLNPEVSGFRMILAVIDVGRLVAIQENWRLSSHGSIVLMRDDATLLSRAPLDEALLGRNFKDSVGYRERERNSNGSYLSENLGYDGVRRIVSYERLDEFGLYVTVTRGYDDALTQFYRLRAYVFLGMAFLTFCVLGAVLAIQRAQNALLRVQQSYQRLALVDDLTKVMNRRAFMSEAERELCIVKERGGNLAVLMIDIDHFKHINDRFGHSAGDEVLKSVSFLWRGALRQEDLLGRLGGEEFSVILPGADPVLAGEIANRLRMLTEAEVTAGPIEAGLTISIGVAVWNGGQDGMHDLLRRADEALYLAKKNGRNRVEMSAPECVA